MRLVRKNSIRIIAKNENHILDVSTADEQISVDYIRSELCSSQVERELSS